MDKTSKKIFSEFQNKAVKQGGIYPLVTYFNLIIVYCKVLLGFSMKNNSLAATESTGWWQSARPLLYGT